MLMDVIDFAFVIKFVCWRRYMLCVEFIGYTPSVPSLVLSHLQVFSIALCVAPSQPPCLPVILLDQQQLHVLSKLAHSMSSLALTVPHRM